MVPTVVIERSPSPGGGELVLSRRGDEFSIRVGGVELMNSRNHASEDELGKASCAPLAAPSPRVLIGGLGMGYTLRAALEVLPAAARVDIAEIVPAVVQWNRGVLGPLAGHPLDDPRVTVIEDDVGKVIAAARGYDAIILDVDNGPDGVYRDNRGLYQQAGLAAARAALVPGGLYAVWSSFESPTFTRWLKDAGFDVELRTIHPHRRARHYIWFARKI